MSDRKCVYTGKDADTRDLVIPKKIQEVLHNWANKVPASSEYLKNKQGRLPNELEMEASRLFYLLEIAKMDVVFFTKKLDEVRAKLAGVKTEEIEKAHHIKDLTESFEEQVQEKLAEDKKIDWD